MLPCGLPYTLRSIAYLGWIIRQPPRCTLLHVMIATGLGTIESPANAVRLSLSRWRNETVANKLALFAQLYRWLIAGDLYLLASVGIEEGRE